MRKPWVHLGAITLALGLTWTTPRAAEACGGFFCDNVNPVVQTAERVLFRINDDDTTTVIVEVQYQGPPSDFGWILPVAAGITTDDLGTAPPGLFDALEEKTAPRFERPSYGQAAGIDDDSGGCSLRRSRSDFVPPPPDTSGVEVVGEAVVGPYAVELITADKAENLSNWLIVNGYQISQTAIPAMDHYIDLEMAFIGLKLTADVPAGPVDAFSFTVPGRVPSLPLVLTSVAAAADMEIITYIAGGGRHVPANGDDVELDYGSVRWLSEDETDYTEVLDRAIGDGAQRWHTEFASIMGELVDIQDTPIDEVLDRDDYLNRYHTFMSPAEMTYDPYWIPSAIAPDIDNLHYLDDTEDYSGELDASGSGSSAPLKGMMLVLMPLLLALPRRRRTFS